MRLGKGTVLAGLGLVVSLAAGFRAGLQGGYRTDRTAMALPDQEQGAAQPAQGPPSEEVIPFKWDRIESTNYQQFVENLRTVGCPEPTIRAVVRAELERYYAPRFAKIAQSDNYANLPAQNRERRAKRDELANEIDSVMYDQLGIQRPVRSASPLFTLDEEGRITQALTQFPRIRTEPTDSDGMARAESNRLARVQFLSQYFTPEQMLYYKLDREGDGLRIERLLQGMQPTKDEFLGVAKVVESKDTALVNGAFKADVAEALQSALSSDRFALLQLLQRPEYQRIFSFARQYQLPDDATAALVSLRRNAFTQDEAAYRQKVLAVLTQPQMAAGYLNDRTIHPHRSQ